MMKPLVKLDRQFISYSHLVSQPLARFALFTVFFWFGILKVLGQSPASPLVAELLERTLPFLTFAQFIVCFGIYEMVIGILFLIPRTERLALVLLVPHLFTTVLPLILLPGVTWNGFLTPTLEGQYIIKNLIIIALAVSLTEHLRPLKK